MEQLFSEAINQDESGSWFITQAAASGYAGVTRAELDQLVEVLNLSEDSQSLAVGSGVGGVVQPAGAKEFGMCVLKGIIPGWGLVDVNWGNVYIWIKQRSWGRLSKYLAKHAAKKGVKDLAKLTPAGLATSVIGSAAGCAIWG